ncbi:hypothetical protein GUITHDRAFT_132741 [Guillardia theta CCMP2712]|uniref:Uncharacterized protein n=1 Tax=Guillardia theta (strain CCMP2712) TaxID=905079 RepID=L1JZA1_GUITC|nr:hypothetical protein GUITHDRAFT_132741 [Guillardia theta CCMP2712]EKX53644.1 hypothetical protein GUITHDRAFT_132741 [Guillardia theta CCMP2712]|eukprot:XP_005840624.1 hypothetical protein GUITHDRAFT_132741 [Guillardia theta CCMP2712]
MAVEAQDALMQELQEYQARLRKLEAHRNDWQLETATYVDQAISSFSSFMDQWISKQMQILSSLEVEQIRARQRSHLVECRAIEAMGRIENDIAAARMEEFELVEKEKLAHAETHEALCKAKIEISTLHDKARARERLIETLQSKVNKFEEQTHLLESELNRRSLEFMDKDKELTKCRERLTMASNQSTESLLACEKLKAQVESSDYILRTVSALMKCSISDLPGKVDALSHDYASLQEKYSSCLQELDRQHKVDEEKLRNCSHSLQALEKNCTSLEVRLETTENWLILCCKLMNVDDYSLLPTKTEQLLNEYSCIRATVSKYENRIETLEKTSLIFKNEMNEVISRQENENQLLQNRLQELQSSLDQQLRKTSCETERNLELERTVSILKSELENLSFKNYELGALNASLNLALKDTEANARALQHKYQSYEYLCQNLERENEQLLGVNHALQNAKMNCVQSSLNPSYASMRNENEALRDTVMSLEKTCVNLETQKKAALKNQDLLLNELRNLRQPDDQLLRTHNERLSQNAKGSLGSLEYSEFPSQKLLQKEVDDISIFLKGQAYASDDKSRHSFKAKHLREFFSTAKDSTAKNGSEDLIKDNHQDRVKTFSAGKSSIFKPYSAAQPRRPYSTLGMRSQDDYNTRWLKDVEYKLLRRPTNDEEV